MEILPSQVQADNTFMILVLIPLFTFVIYPLVEKVIKLTPLRKIGTGLALMVLSFVVFSLSQEAIDRGEMPHVGWQIFGYLILTSAEVMVSIVGLEFFYTQAPKKNEITHSKFQIEYRIHQQVSNRINENLQYNGTTIKQKTIKNEIKQENKRN